MTSLFQTIRIGFKELVFSALLIGVCLLTPFDYWIYLLLGFLYGSYLIVSYRHPKWVCWLIIFILPLTRVPKFTQYVEFGQYAMVVPVAVFWILKKFLKEFSPGLFKQNPFNFFIVGMSVTILMTTLLSQQELNTTPLFSHFINFAFLYLLYDLFVIQRMNSRRFIWLLCLAGFMESVLAILQYFMFKWNLLSFLQPFLLPGSSRARLSSEVVQGFTLEGYRSYGTFYAPNLLGLYLAMIWPLCLSLFLSTNDKKKKIVLFFAFLIISLGIFFSDSRGAMINVLGGGIFLMIFAWKKIPKRIFSVLLIGLVILVALYFDPLRHFLRIEGGLSYRDVIWNHSVELFQAHPLAGWGLGTMARLSLPRYGFPSLDDLDIALSEIIFNYNFDFLKGFHTHNLFLSYAVETGLPGMLLIVYFYYYCLKEFLCYMKTCGPDLGGPQLLAVGCASAIVGNFFHSFFEVETNFYYLPIGLTFVFIVSILFSHIKITSKNGNAQTTG